MNSTSSGLGCNRLWIVGGGGAALQAWAVVSAQCSLGYELCGFIVKEYLNFEAGNLAVCKEELFLRDADPVSDRVIIAVGQPSARQRLAELYRSLGFRSPSIIHPTAVLGPRVVLGDGCVVMPNSIIETHVVLGDYVFVNLAAVIAHECRVGSFCNVGPNVCMAGRSSVGTRCELGAASVLRPNITLGDDVIVGAGSAVVCDQPDGVAVAGCPARLLFGRSGQVKGLS